MKGSLTESALLISRERSKKASYVLDVDLHASHRTCDAGDFRADLNASTKVGGLHFPSGRIFAVQSLLPSESGVSSTCDRRCPPNMP
jgi:hypothetical protein